MAATRPRPLSPHLTIWKWGPHMLVSILHRFSGGALSVAGLGVLTWWLWALADGPKRYDDFLAAAGHPLGLIVLVGLSWAFFLHLLTGVRHLFMDAGEGFELKTNKSSATAAILGSLLLTAMLWAYILGATR